MEVHIFDVEHGSCNALASPSGRLLLVDCGHNDTTGWRPSGWISARGSVIDNLVITNFDEDHLTDLPNVRRSCQIKSFTVNWNVSPDWIRRTKSQFGMGPGVFAAVQMMEGRAGYDPRNPLLLGPGVSIDWGGGCSVEYFYHTPAQFPDENGLSVVTFVQYRAIRIVFPGDLTAPAWRAFLLNPRFRALLGVTNIFVASHHGRRDGYCPDVFDVCRPAVIVISDKSIMYETQTVDYGQHATGITWNQTEMRHCLTTRQDGKLTITPTETGGFWIRATG